MKYAGGYEGYVATAAERLKGFIGDMRPQFGITLGSGLGGLSDAIEKRREICYAEIPNFPETTVEGHEGKLIAGRLNGVPIIGLKGRKHFYETEGEEGILETVFAVHVLAQLGVPGYFVTNAAGGLNPDYNVGDMMIIKSHINLIPNPLRGRHMNFRRLDGGRVWRFQPMNDAYDPEMSGLLKAATVMPDRAARTRSGVYLAVTGPNYETDAECIAFRDGLGADAVGMSTAPEVIVARNRGMKCVGFSCITNKIGPDGTNATNHDEVKAVLESNEVKNRFAGVVNDFFGLFREYKPNA